MPEFVLLLGMERFSHHLFAQIEATIRQDVPDFRLHLFEDHDIQDRPKELEAAISRSSCLFLTLITLTEYAEWLVPIVEKYKPTVVFSFESLPEVLRLTKVGSYQLKESKGMPKPVQNVARMLVGGREEDIFYGYVKLQKFTNRILDLLPGKKFNDFRNWARVSTYWTNRNPANLSNMFKLILREYCDYKHLTVLSPVEIPTMGFAHPDAPHFFTKPEEYEKWEKQRKRGQKSAKSGTVAVLSFRTHILSGMTYPNDIVQTLEKRGLRVIPIFCMGIETHVAVREWFKRLGVDVIINTMGFPLVGGPAGSSKAGLTTSVARDLLSKLDVPYIVAQPLFVQEVTDWQERGVGPIQSTILYSLPEMDGAVTPVVLGGMQGGTIKTLPDRLERLAQLVSSFIKLRQKANADKKIAIIVYNYPPGMGNIATAALLDVPKSLVNLLLSLRKAGYTVGNFPEDSTALVHLIEESIKNDKRQSKSGFTVERSAYYSWVKQTEQQRIEQRWGNFPGEIAPLGQDKLFLGGLQFGNVYLGVQPPMGIPGDPMRLLFDRENTPHHQYLIFYRWLTEQFGADALIHVGMHGTAEWMPGLQLGVTNDCWPDVLLGTVPNFYIYPINNPAEANIAKRRGYSTIISHAIPPYGRAGLYKELVTLKDLLTEYRERPNLTDYEEAILQKVDLLNLGTDLSRQPAESFPTFASRVYAYLRQLEQTLIIDSLHILGEASPLDQQLTLLTETLKVTHDGLPSLADLMLEAFFPLGKCPFKRYADLLIAARAGDPVALEIREKLDTSCTIYVKGAILEEKSSDIAWAEALGSSPLPFQAYFSALSALTNHGRVMANALKENTQELAFLLKALKGEYVPAGPGGDLIRDGLDILPTGRNIHALDPFRIPTDAAFTRGVKIANSLLEVHLRENEGAYPETIAQVLWGLDTIKTKGEAIGTVLGLIGARPVKDGQGKIGRYELIPLAELGRPRIDVLMTTSGIFRDTFAGTMDLLDRLVREAATVEEPSPQNFIRKHVLALVEKGVSFEQATARIFTQAPGTYGTDVDDAIEGGAWEQRQELEDLFVRRNAYAFGGKKDGAAHPEVLNSLLGTVERVAQEIDSVEFGLTDLQHYYGYSGALKAAAERRSGRPVKLSFVESFTAETKVQDLEQVLRLEYRTKLLNPKWYEGMLRHGYNGAAEIGNRFTYLLGWSATTDAVDQWVYDQASTTFVLDDAMRERLEAANPEAARNAIGRLLEAQKRGFWQADDATLAKLQELYTDLEDRLEGVG